MLKSFWKEKIPRDKKYLLWIDSLPCSVKNCPYPSTHHHVPKKYHGAMGRKTSDYRTIPLCYNHHNLVHSIGKDSFQKKYCIDFEEVIESLHDKFYQKNNCTIPE